MCLERSIFNSAASYRILLQTRIVSWLLTGLVAALIAHPWGTVHGEELAEDEVPDPPSEIVEVEAPSQPLPVRAAQEDGPGVIGNLGFLGMGTFGRDDSIAPAEILPYLLLDEDFLFGDVRGFVSTEGHFGGNFGVGYRRLVPNQHAWYGVNAWYDVDDTSSQMFHQLGIGVEAAFQSFELRSNAYFPVGETEQTLEQQAANPRFVNNQLVIDQQILRGYALSGVDAEVGYVLPLSKLGEDSVVRLFVGGYFFDGITGIQTRSEAQIASTVTTHVQFSNDDEYGSNLMVGVSLDFPFGESHPTARWRRNTPSPFRFVHRNYNVILDRRDESQLGVAAINPRTGSAYRVAHVDSAATGGGTGGVDDPLQNLSSAQASGADLIFVHAGSTLNESIVLGDNTWLVGDSGNQWIDLPKNQTALLPSMNQGNSTPTISGITGDAITLGSGSRISGLAIGDIQGNGLVGNGVGDISIRDIEFFNISGNAIQLTDSTGTMRLANLTADNVQGDGLFVSGGSANFDLRSSTFQEIGGDAIRFQGVTGGTIDLTLITAEDIAGHGLALTNVDADLNSSVLKISDSDESAIEISGGTGTHTFSTSVDLDNVASGVHIADTAADITFGLLKVATNTTDPAILMENATGEMHLNLVDITTDGGAGIVLQNVDDLTISAGNISTQGAAAFDAEDSHFEVQLTKIEVDDAPFGIRLSDVTGGFSVVGKNGVGGEIANSDVGVLLENAGSVILNSMEFVDNDTGIRSSGTDLLAVVNSKFLNSTHFAIDSHNDPLVSIQNSLFTGNKAIDGATIRLRVDETGTYRSEILSNTISDLNGTPILITNDGAPSVATLDTRISGNLIEAARGNRTGIHVNWNGTTGVQILDNDLTLTGTGMTGILVNSTSTADTFSGTINGNAMELSGSNSIGVNLVSASASNLQLQSNLVSLTGAGGTGLRFELSETTSAWLAANTIVDSGSAATGIHFVKLADNSRLQLDGNTIQMTSTSSAVDRGIIFTTIDGTVQLFGTSDNTVTGATDTFFIPSGKTSGGFSVNGVVVP